MIDCQPLSYHHIDQLEMDNVWYFGNLLAVLLRWTTGQHSYSGQSQPPLFGDYEAQRHWMEVTVNLEPNKWYTNSSDNDLQYWGLDYPPLTAYHSYLNGKIAQFLNPLWIELNKSRGYEGYYHKMFMRSTVLIVDLLLYFTAICKYWSLSLRPIKKRDKSVNCIISLINPALILIDYGHFQYNCVSLGLFVWTINFLMEEKDVLAAIAFSLALNYKQMTLYYSFPIFWYLLSRCWHQKNYLKCITKLLSISSAVILTFVILWIPYIHSIESILQVLHRIFPFARGIYEDKVANFWFSISVLIKIKNYFTDTTLARLSAIITLLSLVPSSLKLFRSPTIINLKYALINSSLVFFLFSFQVHEKTILMVSIPIILVMDNHPLSCLWFVVVSTFSLQPLLIKDGLMMPYFSLTIFFVLVYFNAFEDLDIWSPISWKEKLTVFSFISSLMGCLLLSITSITVSAPTRWPHIHAVVNCLFCCSHFFLFSLYFHKLQFETYKIEITAPKTNFTKIKPKRKVF